ncbi:NAD(P)H-dependent glycerol-3-phosphate dehydrogenase [bacterium]|nr:NAD(P)H-dependent glycerol-3-phosphate dehydrogenase [bacterium]
MSTKITILGGGAMATACAILLAEHPEHQVFMWVRQFELAEKMQATRENRRLLPGIRIPDSVTVTADLDYALPHATALVAAIPTQFLRASLTHVHRHLSHIPPVISVAKGIENDTLLRPTEIIQQVLAPPNVAALSGPSHAEEVGHRLPATVVAASRDLNFSRQVQHWFNTDRFRVYTNIDLIGVELAGALKNVIAIAAGISDGLGYGDNAKSALLTRSLVEMTRFGVRFGAEPSTFTGLAGIGDLITTCFSPFGRNRQVGRRLGEGEPLDHILQSMVAVAEGVTTAKSIYQIATEEGIDMPIVSEVYQVLFHGKSPAEATNDLMLRPLKPE